MKNSTDIPSGSPPAAGKASRSATAKPPVRPPKDERDEIRRTQIVEAAKQCVCRRGFHGASIAEIAAEAKMSAGQIYRYFVNKEAIIAEVVARIVAVRLEWIATTAGLPDLAAHLADRLLAEPSEQEVVDETLLREVTAEAARNPAISAIVRDVDRQFHAMAERTLKTDYPAFSDLEVAVRVEVMASISEGFGVRRILGHEVDRARLHELFRQLIEVVLPPR